MDSFRPRDPVSYRPVMFSQVSVCLFRVSPCDHYPWPLSPFPPQIHRLYQTWNLPPPRYWHCRSSLETCSNVFIWWPTPFQIVVTSGGGCWNTYGWKAGGKHPSGMLSCLNCCQLNLFHSVNIPGPFVSGNVPCAHWEQVLVHWNVLHPGLKLCTVRVRLDQASASMLQQLCDDASYTTLIENNRVASE